MCSHHHLPSQVSFPWFVLPNLQQLAGLAFVAGVTAIFWSLILMIGSKAIDAAVSTSAFLAFAVGIGTCSMLGAATVMLDRR
jgi:hypothetical protein